MNEPVVDRIEPVRNSQHETAHLKQTPRRCMRTYLRQHIKESEMEKQDEIIEPPYVEVCGEKNMVCGEVAEDGEYTFGIFLSNGLADNDVEQAVFKWIGSVHEEEEVSLTIRLRLRDVYKELYGLHCFNDGSVDEEAMPLFDALRKDCEWIINQIKGLKKGEMDGTT